MSVVCKPVTCRLHGVPPYNGHHPVDGQCERAGLLAHASAKTEREADILLTRRSDDDDLPTMAQTWHTLLEPFTKGQQLPEKARTDPSVVQREEEPMTITKLWQYVPFLAVQGVYRALVSGALKAVARLGQVGQDGAPGAATALQLQSQLT